MKADDGNEEKAQVVPRHEWQSFTHEELCGELRGIKDLPEQAVEAIATAVFLCAPLPGPVRAAWKTAIKPLDRLIAALIDTNYEPDFTTALWELRSHLQRRRAYELLRASAPPIAWLAGVAPRDDDAERTSAEPLEKPSNAPAIERAGTRTRKKEHYDEFLVICARVLEEAGCARESENRRNVRRLAEVAQRRTVVDLLTDIVNIAWNDSSQLRRSRSTETVRRARRKAASRVSKSFPRSPFGGDTDAASMIELLTSHRNKRGHAGLGRVWLRR